jgi:hypothetical protein
MTASHVAQHGGVPTLQLDGHPVPGEVAYVRQERMEPFLKASFCLFTVTTPARRDAGMGWLGPGR